MAKTPDTTLHLTEQLSSHRYNIPSEFCVMDLIESSDANPWNDLLNELSPRENKQLCEVIRALRRSGLQTVGDVRNLEHSQQANIRLIGEARVFLLRAMFD